MQTTPDFQSPKQVASGSSNTDFTRILYEMARGRTISVWVQTSGLPAEVKDLVTEKNCLCLTLPPDWQGDVARLGAGSFTFYNDVNHDLRRNNTYIAVGGGQVELDYRKQRGIDCLRTQFPVLFLHRAGWTLVAYAWEPCETHWLESLIRRSGPNFNYDTWVEDGEQGWQQEQKTPDATQPIRPELYVTDPLLCADWEPVDDKDVEASCARVLGY